MRIGIDAQMLCGTITGIGRYTSEIIRKLVHSDSEFFLYAPKPPATDEWAAANVTVRSSDFESRIGKILWSQTQLPYCAGKDRLDIFWGPTHRLPRLLPDRIARVVTIHDLVWKHAGETMRPLNRLAERVLMPDAIRLADRVIADSHSTADAIIGEFPWAQDRVRVVYLGATSLPEPKGIEALNALGIDRPYFLFVGTLEPRKNLRRLLEAYASLDQVVRQQTLLAIAGGKGWGNEDMVSLVRSLNLTDSVRLMGYVNEEQLSTLYAHARFLAMPSLYEGFGLPLVEAMSFGVPALTSSRSSLPEVVGDAGVLVDPYNTDSLATGLLKMLKDDEFRNELATRSRPNAARFSWENAARETMGIFQEAVCARNSRRSAK